MRLSTGVSVTGTLPNGFYPTIMRSGEWEDDIYVSLYVRLHVCVMSDSMAARFEVRRQIPSEDQTVGWQSPEKPEDWLLIAVELARFAVLNPLGYRDADFALTEDEKINEPAYLEI